jgi:hypothetical protein
MEKWVAKREADPDSSFVGVVAYAFEGGQL